MKIALVEPRAPDYNVYTHWMKDLPLLGLPYLGAILKQRGHDVTIFNENIAPIETKELSSNDVVGFSLMTSTAPRGYYLAERLREENPDVKIIMGGSHATFLPHEAEQYADHVITGEAESIIADVAENGGANIIHGKPIENLDSLPFPDLSLIKRYKMPPNMIPISTSRGCPSQCDFCSVSPMFGRKYRFRSAKSVIEELSNYKKINSIFFYDDNFTANKNRTKELLEEMIKSSITPKWIAQAKSDVYKDEGLLKLMKKSNCYALCIGFESTNDQTLKEYKKKQTAADIGECIRTLHEYNIKVHGMFLSEGFYNYHKLGIDTLQLSIPVPLPGSNLFEKVKASGRFLSDRNPLKDAEWWKYFDGGHVVHINDKINPKELQEQTIKSLKKFYSKWNCFKQMIKFKFDTFHLRRIGNKVISKWMKSNRSFMDQLDKYGIKQVS